MATAFQANAFQHNAFQIVAAAGVLTVTDTVVKMQLPVNCVLAGDQKEPGAGGRLSGLTGALKRIFGE